MQKTGKKRNWDLVFWDFIYKVTVGHLVHLFSNLFTKLHLLSIYYMQEIVLDAKNTAVNTNKVKFLLSWN